ncbi:MAG: acetyltransferase [Spirochaetes bacterium]|nr:MAG: acetyltransferase [Spirochaetota bacterium]
MKRILILVFVMMFAAGGIAFAGAAKSTYPVVFAHGMGGFDDILGHFYFADDSGVWVGDTCQFLEIGCNEDIDSNQLTLAASVTPFQSSEVRGTQLADQIESYMATVGASKINIVGHSQGGIDARKAAKLLYQRKGAQVVRVIVSVSSPHRGSPVAKYILDQKPGVTSVLSALMEIYGDIVYAPGNDAYASLKSLVYNDYSASDGVTTGLKVFNTNYPVSSTYAYRYASIITGQDGLSVNPALYLLSEGFFDIDGDGYCTDDCDNDGAAGKGNGVASGPDDDGLVGINSQQMGYRLTYTENLFGFDSISTNANLGYVGSINYPTSAQMTSQESRVNQDHADVIGLGPDTFDEPEFYAAIINYIASFD